MRPYLAIIKDSFRAALSTKVLIVMLIVITILLLAVAPFYYKETLDGKIDGTANVPSPYLLFEKFVDNYDKEDQPVIADLWSRLSESTQKKMIEVVAKIRAESNDDAEITDEANPGQSADDRPEIKKGPQRRGNDFFEHIELRESLIAELNTIIEDPGYYKEEVWKGKTLSNEAKEFLETGPENLSPERSRRLNRLLVGKALVPAIKQGNPTSLEFKYTPWWTVTTVNTTHEQFKGLISDWIPYLFDKFILSIGLIIAIIVTSNIIPETFEPGSLNLLLSKPISRSALLVSKFIGGCAFIALCAIYLFAGLWLWLGLGLGIWDPAILWSIPLYILVFAMYYSVSTFFGVWYRSPIVSVILTALFWAFCFTIGTIYATFDRYMHNAAIVAPVVAGENVVCADLAHGVFTWDNSKEEWNDKTPRGSNPAEGFGAAMVKFTPKLDRTPDREFPQVLAPSLDPKSNKILMGALNFGDPDSMRRPPVVAVNAETLEVTKLGIFPSSTIEILQDDKGPILVDVSGRFKRLDLANAPGVASKKKSETDKTDGSEAMPDEPEPGFEEGNKADQKKSEKTNLVKRPNWITSIGRGRSVSGAESIAGNAKRNEIAIFSSMTVFVYSRGEEDKYELDRQVELDFDLPEAMSGQITYAGDTIFVILGNGQAVTLDATSLEEKKSYHPETRSAFRQSYGSEDGRWFAVLYRNGRLWLLDTENDEQMKLAKVRGQGTISGMTFDGSSFWVCDRTDRMTQYSLETQEQQSELVPPSGLSAVPFRFCHRNIIEPFYWICPKPGEFYKLVTHLSGSSDTKLNQQVDLRKVNEKKSPWGPLWSGLAFMALMLGLSCMMFQFSDY